MTCRFSETGMYINYSMSLESTTTNYWQTLEWLNNTRTSEYCTAVGWHALQKGSHIQCLGTWVLPIFLLCQFSFKLLTDCLTPGMTSRFIKLSGWIGKWQHSERQGSLPDILLIVQPLNRVGTTQRDPVILDIHSHLQISEWMKSPMPKADSQPQNWKKVISMDFWRSGIVSLQVWT